MLDNIYKFNGFGMAEEHGFQIKEKLHI